MFNNSSKIMFLSIMMSGTMLSVSSTSWLSAWMGLEINLLAFIPLMTASKNLMSNEAALKYFLTQALASSILLMTIIVLSMKNINEMMNSTMVNMMMMSALMLKLGAAPFHFWFPSVMEGLSWMNSIILMTWQKIAPLMLSSMMMNTMYEFVTTTAIMSAVLGSLGGLNQTSLRKIMAFSSINHIAWMLAAMMSSESLWYLYFLTYSILSFNVIMLFKTLELNQMNQLFSSMFSSKTLKFLILMNMLSLGGLPPFTGFLPKLMVIQSMMMNNQIMMMIIMTILSLITLFFYLRMAHSAFMLNYHETIWNMKQESNNKMILLLLLTSFISNFGLFSMSLIFMVL